MFPLILKGLPGAPGIAIGQALVAYPPANLEVIPDRVVTDIDAEIESFQDAVQSVQDDMRDYANRMSSILPAEELALFDALLMMLGGDSLIGETIERIRAGNWAPGALRETIGQHVRVFESMEDSYMRERASDIRDLGRRILTRIQSDIPATRCSIRRPYWSVKRSVSGSLQRYRLRTLRVSFRPVVQVPRMWRSWRMQWVYLPSWVPETCPSVVWRGRRLSLTVIAVMSSSTRRSWCAVNSCVCRRRKPSSPKS